MKTNFINTSLKVRANHIAFLCESLDETIKEVKHKLLQIAPNDKETYIIYKNKVYDLLKMWLKDEKFGFKSEFEETSCPAPYSLFQPLQ